MSCEYVFQTGRVLSMWGQRMVGRASVSARSDKSRPPGANAAHVNRGPCGRLRVFVCSVTRAIIVLARPIWMCVLWTCIRTVGRQCARNAVLSLGARDLCAQMQPIVLVTTGMWIFRGDAAGVLLECRKWTGGAYHVWLDSSVLGVPKSAHVIWANILQETGHPASNARNADRSR